MTFPELIAFVALVNQYDEMMELNDVKFPSASAPNILFGMTTELFFNSDGSANKKRLTVELTETYYRACDPHPNFMAQGESSTRLTEEGDIRRFLATSRADDPTQDDLQGEMVDPRRTLSFYILAVENMNRKSAPSYGDFRCLIDGEGYRGGGSSITYNNVLEYALIHGEYCISEFVRGCEIFQVFHAVSGIALLFATYSSYEPQYAFPLFQRFPGLLYADGGAFSSDIKRRTDVIRDVNWLTAISQEMFERIGGEPAAAQALGPEIIRHPYSGGVVFQAGPVPRLGDVNAGDFPDAYRQVARFLKPLQFTAWTPPYYLRTPDGVDRGLATQAWITRFD